MICKGRSIGLAREGQDRLQSPPELERQLGRDLVGAIGNWRDKPELRNARREAVAFALEQCAPGFLDHEKDLADAFSKPLDVAFREHLGTVAGDADG
jgi:hypothetical protein